MRCPHTHQEIEDLATYIRRRKKSSGLTAREIRFEVISFNYPHLDKPTIERLYLVERYSLPDFQREHGLNYEQTQFLLDWFGIPKRGASAAGKASVSKRETTCLQRYGKTNPSQLDEVKVKKAATFVEHYGVDNIWKTQEFKDGLDGYYMAKYGIGYGDFQTGRSRRVWENKSPEAKAAWLEKSILSEQAQDRKVRRRDGNNISKAETRISDLLTEMGVTHTRQLCLTRGKKRLYYDLHIPNLNLIIEFNGDYWHANPATYGPDDIIPFRFAGVCARDIWEKDRVKLDLAHEKGYRVLVIWERETLKLTSSQLKTLIEDRIRTVIGA